VAQHWSAHLHLLTFRQRTAAFADYGWVVFSGFDELVIDLDRMTSQGSAFWYLGGGELGLSLRPGAEVVPLPGPRRDEDTTLIEEIVPDDLVGYNVYLEGGEGFPLWAFLQDWRPAATWNRSQGAMVEVESRFRFERIVRGEGYGQLMDIPKEPPAKTAWERLEDDDA
jgi:hypothetical protein